MNSTSALVESFTPLTLGTTGVHEGTAFTVVGRAQLHYGAGLWNHWYLRFNDGSDGWLSEADHLITVTRERRVSVAHLPSFEEIKPGSIQLLEAQKYWVAERRVATFFASEGELPYPFNTDSQMRVIALRSKQHYAFVDYSSASTRVFVGETYLDWNSLLLKGSRQFSPPIWSKVSTQGKQTLCPHCRQELPLYPGQTSLIFCRFCCAYLSIEDEKLELVSKLPYVQQLSTPLKLGDRCTINGSKYEVVGIKAQVYNEELRKTSDSFRKKEAFSNEYCLASPEKPLLYLKQDRADSARTKWELAAPLNHWPDPARQSELVHVQDKIYVPHDFFHVQTMQGLHAVGSFTQEFASKNLVHIKQFRTDDKKEIIQSRKTQDCFGWYYISSHSNDQISQWFNRKIVTSKPKESLSFLLFSLVATLLIAAINWKDLQTLYWEANDIRKLLLPVGLILIFLWLPVFGLYSASFGKIYFTVLKEDAQQLKKLGTIFCIYLSLAVVGSWLFFRFYKFL